jgi:predicted RNA-binding protein with PIN domain
MVVLIDGYNLLRQIMPQHKRTPDAQKQHLIKLLSSYKAKKKKELKDVILVFDAGPFSHASREVKQGVSIIFSGQKSSADEWIIEYAEKHKELNILVVTKDRKLIQECTRHGTSSMDVFEFYSIMQNSILNDPQYLADTEKQAMTLQSDAIKYDELTCDILEKFNKPLDVDLLMEEASITLPQKDNSLASAKKNKGCSLALSKKEKKLYATLKKLK